MNHYESKINDNEYLEEKLAKEYFETIKQHKASTKLVNITISVILLIDFFFFISLK